VVNTEIFSGNVYGKGEVAREEAEARQQKREKQKLAREYTQMRVRRKKEERAAKREEKQREALAREREKNEPVVYYHFADEWEYRRLLARHFEENPAYISFWADGRPTTDDILKDVLGLNPERCGQIVRRAFCKVMAELGFYRRAGYKDVKLTDVQYARRLKRHDELIEDMQLKVRHVDGLTKTQKKLLKFGPSRYKTVKCSFWQRPSSGPVSARAPDDNQPIRVTYVPKTGTPTSPKLPARTITVVQPIEEPYARGDTKKAMKEFLDNNPEFYEDGFRLDDLRNRKPPIPFVGRASAGTQTVRADTAEALLVELGYHKSLLMNYGVLNKCGPHWFKDKKEEQPLHQPQAIGFGKYEEPDEEDLFLADPKYKDFDTLDDDDDLTGPDTKGVHAKSTGTAPLAVSVAERDALDGYYDELDDDEDFA